MLKWVVVLLCAAAISGIASGILSTADYQHYQCNYANTAKEANQKSANIAQELHSLICWVIDLTPEAWTALATLLLVLVTCLLGGIAYLQIKTTQRQLRAYVSVGFGEIFTQNRLLRFETRPVIVNVGQTPARDVRVVSRTDVVTVPIPLDFDFYLPEEANSSNVTLGQQQSFFTSSIVKRRVTRGELRQMLGRPQAMSLFIYGTVRYRDIFGKSRFTNFSYTVLARKSFHLWNATARHNDSN